MAVSHANRPRLAAGLIAAASLAAATLAGESPLRRDLPISLDAASSEVDYRTNMVIFHDVVISQGDITVKAERAEATGIDFENSRWTFTDNVAIRMEHRGNLQSDEAFVSFRNNRIAQAIIKGRPATFEQRLAETDRTARGRAENIEYEVATGTVRLAGNAWLSDGRQEINSPVIVYDVREENVRATTAPESSDRVRIKILPRQSGESGAQADPQ